MVKIIVATSNVNIPGDELSPKCNTFIKGFLIQNDNRTKYKAQLNEL